MKEPIYEQELAKQGVVFEYVANVFLSDIDVRKSLANQARLQNAIVDDVVEQYRLAYLSGGEFPPLVLWRPSPTKKLIALDGNQRIAAATKASRKAHDAYIITSSDRMVVDRIAWSFNNHVNGLRLTQEDCIEHAITFVRKYGYAAKAAAAEWGVPKWMVEKKVRAAEMRERLQKLGSKHANRLSDDNLWRMSHLDTLGDDVFMPAAEAVAESGASSKDIEKLVENVRKERTHAGKVAAVGEFASADSTLARRAETKSGTIKRRTPLPRERLAQLLSEMSRLLESYPDRKAFLPPAKADVRKVTDTAHDVVQKLVNVFGLGTNQQIGDVG